MRTKKAGKSDLSKESFRNLFWKRLTTAHGNVNKAAAAIGRFQQSVSNWQHKGAGLPNIYDAARIAAELGYRPAWLSFGEDAGPMTEAEKEIVDLIRQCRPSEQKSFIAMLKSILEPRRVKLNRHEAAVVAASEGLPVDIETTIVPKDYAARAEFPGIARQDGNATVIEPLASLAGEEPTAEPVSKKARRINRRNELAVFNLFEHGQSAQRIRGYRGLAAGEGRELEECEELYYVRELRKGSGYTYARVHGDSMMDSILPGDVVILQEFLDPPIALPALEKNDSPNPMNIIRSDVPNDTIWIVQINKDKPTLKRVRYELRGQKWKLMIEADNSDVWHSYPVESTDSVRFWAKLKGLAAISRGG